MIQEHCEPEIKLKSLVVAILDSHKVTAEDIREAIVFLIRWIGAREVNSLDILNNLIKEIHETIDFEKGRHDPK